MTPHTAHSQPWLLVFQGLDATQVALISEALTCLILRNMTLPARVPGPDSGKGLEDLLIHTHYVKFHLKPLISVPSSSGRTFLDEISSVSDFP